MKRGRDRDIDEGRTDRDAPAQGPLRVESLGTRGRRLRLGLPIVIGLIVAITVIAFAGKYVARFGAGSEQTPALPTPITWIDTTADPSASPAPTAVASSSAGLIRTINADATAASLYWYRGQANHFTITLTNKSGGPIPLDPCPTYRMYVLNPGAPEGPDRLLNCEAIGNVLAPGQTVSLDMAFTLSKSSSEGYRDPGGYQVIAWRWVSPAGYQANATLKNIFIQP